jgi:hypothetical protein
VPFVFALGQRTWLQSNLLIRDHGVFDGRGASRAQFDGLGRVELAVWGLMLLMAFRFSRRILPLVNLIAWLLVLGQAVLMLARVSPHRGQFPVRWVPVLTHMRLNSEKGGYTSYTRAGRLAGGIDFTVHPDFRRLKP